MNSQNLGGIPGFHKVFVMLLDNFGRVARLFARVVVSCLNCYDGKIAQNFSASVLATILR